MAEVVDVEMEMGYFKNELSFVAHISDECIIGWDTMKMFQMVLDVGRSMVSVNENVLPGCFKYVIREEVLIYPVESVRMVEL